MVTFEPFIHGSGKNFALADIHRNLLSTREAALFVKKTIRFSQGVYHTIKECRLL